MCSRGFLLFVTNSLRGCVREEEEEEAAAAAEVVVVEEEEKELRPRVPVRAPL